ncbi:hypothetical protein ACFOY2_46000 [Nonomuraea purpurea]|uniref:Uncharacterized protein n=1 Tax=Nonomuraea purpurea TaxID=1849276 RepID=A0ABV8GL15_9ACTN
MDTSDRPVSDGAAPLFTCIMHDRPYQGGIRRTWLLQVTFRLELR